MPGTVPDFREHGSEVGGGHVLFDCPGSSPYPTLHVYIQFALKRPPPSRTAAQSAPLHSRLPLQSNPLLSLNCVIAVAAQGFSLPSTLLSLSWHLLFKNTDHGLIVHGHLTYSQHISNLCVQGITPLALYLLHYHFSNYIF